MRVLVVVNPHATATTERQRDVLTQALAGDNDLQIEQTSNRGHAAALACRAMREGCDLVVALGGDGTVNEVVNGLLTDGVHDAVPALGVVPAGSTNVFARSLGLPNDPIEATGILLDAVRNKTSRTIGLGMADERWFIFAAGVGFDAAVITRVERERGRGRRSSNLLYARSGFREYAVTDRRNPPIAIELPDGTVHDGLHLAIVANTDPWTYVGQRALHATPRAGFDTGLDVYARNRIGMTGVLWAVAQMARNRPHLSKRSGLSLHDVAEFQLTATESVPFQVDGDVLSPRRSVHFRSIPEALRVAL